MPQWKTLDVVEDKLNLMDNSDVVWIYHLRATGLKYKLMNVRSTPPGDFLNMALYILYFSNKGVTRGWQGKTSPFLHGTFCPQKQFKMLYRMVSKHKMEMKYSMSY